MLSTLFYIPTSIGGVPVFGFGLVLAVWTVFSIGLLGWLYMRQGFNADTLGYVPLMAAVGAVIWWVLPAISEKAGLPIRGYGVMMLVAALAATALAAWRAKRVGVNPELIFSLAFWMVGLGIIGARAFYVVEYWQRDFQPLPIGQTIARIVQINQGGLVVYGSFFGAVIAITIFVRRHRLPLLPVCDILAPCIMLGLALGRIGCLLNGCCYGGQCDLPWALTFPFNSPPHIDQVLQGHVPIHGLNLTTNSLPGVVIDRVEPDSAAQQAGVRAGERLEKINGYPMVGAVEARQQLLSLDQSGWKIEIATADGKTYAWTVSDNLPRSKAVHPTQIYSTINGLFVFVVLMLWSPHQRRDGELFALLITVYPITRFILEMIRTDERPVFGTGMTISQNVSLLLLLCATALWFYILRRPAGRVLEKNM